MRVINPLEHNGRTWPPTHLKLVERRVSLLDPPLGHDQLHATRFRTSPAASPAEDLVGGPARLTGVLHREARALLFAGLSGGRGEKNSFRRNQTTDQERDTQRERENRYRGKERQRERNGKPHSFIRSPTHPLIHPPTHSSAHPLTHSSAYPLSHLSTNPLTHPHSHPPSTALWPPALWSW